MKKYLYGFSVFILAFGILLLSVIKTSFLRPVFSAPSTPENPDNQEINIDYNLPYPGKVLPDNTFWPVKAARDRLWYLLSFKDTKKAELSLLFSDKRLVMSKNLFERQKPDLAFTTLTKSEKYLEDAHQKSGDDSTFLTKLGLATLKHRQVLNEILMIAPDDAKPDIIVLDNKLEVLYKNVSQKLNSQGAPTIVDPFTGD